MFLFITFCRIDIAEKGLNSQIVSNFIRLKPFQCPTLQLSNLAPTFSGKGDLVGCDISLSLMHNGQMNTGGNQGGQDTILKSSSDVKVGQSVLMEMQKMENWKKDRMIKLEIFLVHIFRL